VPIIGHGGSGKSTVLMRLAHDLAFAGKTVLYHRREHVELSSATIDKFLEQLRGERVFIFIDDGGRVSNLSAFLTSLAEQSSQASIIVTSRPFEWTPNKSYISYFTVLRPQTNDFYSVDILSDSEIWDIITKFAHEGKIRHPADSKRDQIIERYADKSKAHVQN
jgi:GTPase SAR1 family protein